ncbi:MAG: hypothetical protein V3U75_12475 [Methylococcaceae bacterium]
MKRLVIIIAFFIWVSTSQAEENCTYPTFDNETGLLTIPRVDVSGIAGNPSFSVNMQTINSNPIRFELTQANTINSSETETDPQLTQLKAEIDEIIGQASCTEPLECTTIGFGSKPCGGVKSYLVYSILDTNPLLLKNRVNEYNLLDKQRNESLGLVSDCSAVQNPPVVCDNNLCKIVETE